MAVVAKCLFESVQLGDSLGTLYTSTNAVTLIDKFTLVNTTAGAITVDVHVVAAGDTAGADTKVIDTRSLNAHTTDVCPEMVGQILNAGDFIQAVASAASSVNARGSGRTT